MNGSAIKALVLAGVLTILLVPDLAHAINCRVTLVAMSFGTYSPMTASNVDVMGQVNIRCQAQPGSFTVTIGPGLSGNQLARTLVTTGPGILNYNLYRDPARMQIWGDGSPPTFTVSGVRSSQGRPTVYNYPIYGRIFAGQTPDPGMYNDNPVVTVLF